MSELTPELIGFICRYVDSVSRLEILLLLRAQRDRPHTAEEIARGLYTEPAAAAAQLSQLFQMGLAAPAAEGTGAYRYAAPPEADALIAALADAYRERRVAVITAIYTAPPDAARSFADAFRFRK